jgi:hypothetical protein
MNGPESNLRNKVFLRKVDPYTGVVLVDEEGPENYKGKHPFSKTSVPNADTPVPNADTPVPRADTLVRKRRNVRKADKRVRNADKSILPKEVMKVSFFLDPKTVEKINDEAKRTNTSQGQVLDDWVKQMPNDVVED